MNGANHMPIPGMGEPHRWPTFLKFLTPTTGTEIACQLDGCRTERQPSNVTAKLRVVSAGERTTAPAPPRLTRHRYHQAISTQR